MNQVDRITEVRIRNFKAISDLSLKLDGLTVLIGDNGSGKSTILEALEIISKAARPNFLSDVISRQHSGFDSLVRTIKSEFSISVTLQLEGDKQVDYTIAVGKEGDYSIITEEQLLA